MTSLTLYTPDVFLRFAAMRIACSDLHFYLN